MINYRNDRKGKKCVIWTRVSTQYQEENGGSLDYQKTLCEKYVEREGLTIADVGENHGYFGGKHESAKTPGKMIKQMISIVKKDSSIRYVIVSEFDRFSRSNGQAITILEDLRSLGVIAKSAKTGFDTSTKEGFMMVRNSLNVAEWDNDNRADKFYSGRQHCYECGAYIGVLPRGYYREGKSLNSVCYLNDEGRLIGMAFKWKIQGYSNGEILDALKARGLNITKQTLNHYFNNPMYAGKIRSKMLEGGMVDGKIEKAVSWEDWLEVQRLMSNRSGKYKQKKKKEQFPLTHHVACADCGTRFTAYSVKSKGKDYYKCNKIGCKNNVSAPEMHCKYKQLLYAYDLPMSLLLQYENIIRDMFCKHTQESANQVTLLKKRLTEVENDLKKCHLKYATDKIDSETYAVASQELKNKKANLESEIEKYSLDLSNLDEKINQVLVTCSKLGSLWDDGDLETKRKIQELVFPDGILWDREIRNYRTENRNEFFDLLDRFSISYGNKKETPSYEDVSTCAG
ncbi:MAG: recombinase family protein [Paludibacteraceae bacterium]|nr:recombinase family protein [Paludibacteraceae bacterium]